MADIIVEFADGGFDPSFSGTVEDFKDEIVDNLRTVIPATRIILGQVGGSEPVGNNGPWLDSGVWKGYDSGSGHYIPVKIQIGDGSHSVTLSSATLTANRIQTLQNKDGVLALTSDAFGERATITLPYVPSGGSADAPIIDWSLSNNFYQLLSVNVTLVTMINSVPGQEMAWVVNNTAGAHNYTVAGWESNVSWATGVAPTQTSNGVDLYIFKNVAGTIYGNQLANFS